MFAMLNGRWPRVTAGTSSPGDPGSLDVETLVARAVQAQEEAGLDLITDGQVRWADPARTVLGALADGDTGDGGLLVRAWRSTAALTDRAAAQVVPGPYSLARREPAEPVTPDARARRERTLDLAGTLAAELEALAGAGCPMVQVDEPDAVVIGDDEDERTLFATAHARLLAGVPELHAMLLITGGSAWEAGAETILAAPYRSYLFDLIAGPDNWYLVRAAPGERGIVCAALDARSRADQGPILDWASRYAASANGRGPDRVGVANATSLESLTPEAAAEALHVLARAARLGVLPPGEAVAAGLDPRTFPSRVVRGTRASSPEGAAGEAQPRSTQSDADDTSPG